MQGFYGVLAPLAVSNPRQPLYFFLVPLVAATLTLGTDVLGLGWGLGGTAPSLGRLMDHSSDDGTIR